MAITCSSLGGCTSATSIGMIATTMAKASWPQMCTRWPPAGALPGALAGQVYDPLLGFSLVPNVGRKYPYDPFYGGFSPRLSAAWSPHFDNGILGSIFGNGKSVVRGGYSRIYGRLNGVNLVLVPLLGTGIMQGVSCVGASISSQCLGNNGVTPQT